MKLLKLKLLSHKIAIVIIGVFALVSVAMAYALTQNLTVEGDYNYYEAEEQPAVELGASPGTDHYNTERFWGGFGGSVFATTTHPVNATTTLKEVDLYNHTFWEVTIPAAGQPAVFDFPATSTLSTLMTTEGATHSWTFHNTSAATTTTLVAGAGWDFTGVDANVDQLAALSYARLDCVRQKASSTTNAFDIMCGIQELVAAD